ncbi:MAG: Uncharacterised protein [Alphaproteobacteria bacterium UBA4588]|nr:MAG: Uncharacterised protein [Alphaproteobacteria bacterium UBA4588]
MHIFGGDIILFTIIQIRLFGNTKVRLSPCVFWVIHIAALINKQPFKTLIEIYVHFKRPLNQKILIPYTYGIRCSATQRDFKHNSLVGESRLKAWYPFVTDLSIKNNLY